MPDQRGFAGSGPAAGRRRVYRRTSLVGDIFALADTLGPGELCARRPRLGRGDRLAGRAAQRSAADEAGDRQCAASSDLPEEPDRGRRTSARLRNTSTGSGRRARKRRSRRWASTPSSRRRFAGHVELAKIPEAEKQQYIAEWSQPGGMDLDAQLVPREKLVVPPPGMTRAAARLAAAAPFPRSPFRRWSSGA